MNQISNAAITPNLIYVPQTAETDLIKLAQGNLIRATVQRVADEMALININGKVFSVRTEIPLQAQQRVLLQVTNADPAKITFQVIHQSAPAEAAAPALPQTNLQSLLTSWGLEPDQLNQTIAKSLFTHSQSLTPDAVANLRTMWHTVPAMASLPADAGGMAGNIEALAYLHANQIPVTKDSLLLARTWLTNSLPIAESLSTLQQNMQSVQTQVQSLLSTLPNQTQPAAAAPTPPPSPQAQLLTNLLTTLTNAISQTADWSITTNTPAQHIISKLANLVTTLGTPPEANLAQYLSTAPSTTTAAPPTPIPTTTVPPAPPGPAQGGAERGPAPAAAQIPGQATVLPHPNGPAVDSIIGRGEHTGPPAATPIPAGKPELPPLQQLATAVHEALAHPEHLNTNTTQALQQLSRQLDNLSHNLGAIQLSNLSAPPNPVTEPYYMFPIPLQNPNGGNTTAQLRVYRRNGGEEVDPQNMRLALLLDLPGLGEMAIEINLFERHLNGSIMSGQAQTHQLVQTELDDLRQNLSKLGYHVDGFSAKMLAPHQISVFEEHEPIERMADIPMPQINLIA